MKIIKIEREISNKVYVGGYETISPSVRLVAELDPMDDPRSVATQLSCITEQLWVDALEVDVKLTMDRRAASGAVWSDDKTAELTRVIPALKR